MNSKIYSAKYRQFRKNKSFQEVDVMIKRLIQAMLFAVILVMALSACGSGSDDANYESDKTIEAENNDGMDLVDVPTEDYIISCLENTPNILEVAAVTEENDQNGDLNAEGGYYSAVFFSVDIIDQNEVYGEGLIDKGTDAGGCIEAYKTEADAQSRDEYLSGYDDSWLFNAGYHTVVGTLVIRTSQKLTENDQVQLETNIINVFTGKPDNVQPFTNISEKEEEAIPSSEVNADAASEYSTEEITMSQGASEYLGANWTIDSLTEHFEEMGFTNIRTIPCEPNDDNYESNIFELYIETGLFSTDPWETGDKFEPDAEISIYYNESPLLTIENCDDLVTVLTSQDMSYSTFAEKYDGQYVKFDGYVTYHITYNAGIDHIIQVTGGDYDGSVELGHSDDGYYDGLNIYIGDRTMDSFIDESVDEGTPVTVSGKISADWSEYYGNLYVETIYLRKR